MKRDKIGFLQERRGVNSLMRLKSFMTLIFTFLIILIQISNNQVYVELDIVLIVASFVPKALQKVVEVKYHYGKFPPSEFQNTNPKKDNPS